MPAELMQERTNGLEAASENLIVLNHEILFDRTGLVLNLASTLTQQAITQYCLEVQAKCLVLDNLSTLVSGVKENDSDAWEKMLGWLLDLRRRRIAVIVVHHAGRNGEMRGTSRREDAAFWVIKLEDKLGSHAGQGGGRRAHFVSLFTKPSRNGDGGAYEWEFIENKPTGEIHMSFKKALAEEIVLEWVRSGLDSCEQIAKEMNVK